MLEQLLSDGWHYHETESARLAGELEAAADETVPPSLLAPFVNLATHTIGDHLGDWPRALALGRRILRDRPPHADTARAWERLYPAAILASDSVAAVELELAAIKTAPNPLAAILAMRFGLADALAGVGRIGEAGGIYRHSLQLAAEVGPAPDLDRSLAIASNNLAWCLHDLPSRTADDAALMELAAEASLQAWRRCGDWINEELALYLKASAAHATGNETAALALATAGLDVIAANGRRPLDTARFHLLRAKSFAALGESDRHNGALEEADRAAETIPSEKLRQVFAAERAKAQGG
ncbi:MAG TPA: hypothetical protein VMW18_16900 [Candidatus Binatia bacterium]|nr:hypothetical protein [Candidatus Binatia bacterium]